MSDITTIWDAAAGQGDWLLAPATLGTITDQDGAPIIDAGGGVLTDGLLTFSAEPGLAAGADLSTAVTVSLFSDATADADDAIPDGSGDPRGWWAGPIGSKLWLLTRSKRTPTVLATAKSYIADALAWLMADKVAASIDVTTEWQTPGRLAARIVIHRADGTSVSLSYAWAWETV